MGDVCEFTTWPKHQNIFYKLTNNGLVFHIKGEENAAIGLAKHPGENCDFWILIGVDQQCWIKKKNGRTCCNVSTPNILCRDKYRKFWITLNRKELSLGINNQKTPILCHRIWTHKLRYITFSVRGERVSLQWKCYFPPQIEKPSLINIIGGEPQWVKVDKQLPNDALIGGYENGPLYIMRAHHQGKLMPGKFVPELGLGFVTSDGDSKEKSEFEVLCGYNCTWVKTVRDMIPVGAVEGGYTDNGNEILYVGRALCDNHLIPGRVQPSRNFCYISYNSNEIACQAYEILVGPHTVADSINNNYFTGLGKINYMLKDAYESNESEDEEFYEDDY